MPDKFDLEKARKQFFVLRDMLHIIGNTKYIGEEKIDNLLDGVYMNLIEIEQLLIAKLKSCSVDTEKLHQEWREQQ